MYLTLAIAAVPSFLASLVEWVEAFTIVVAVGNTRGLLGGQWTMKLLAAAWEQIYGLLVEDGHITIGTLAAFVAAAAWSALVGEQLRESAGPLLFALLMSLLLVNLYTTGARRTPSGPECS